MRAMGMMGLLAVLLLATPARAEERVVAIVPLGKVDRRLLDVAKKAIEARMPVKVRIDKARPMPEFAWYAPRKRWRAEKLLTRLERDPPPDAWKVVGITEAEISTTKWPIKDWRIGGLGSIGGKGCVVSSWIVQRSSRTRSVFDRRWDDLVAHEFGHTLGMAHCETPGCVMRDAKGKLIQSVDSSTGRYCDRCRAKMP